MKKKILSKYFLLTLCVLGLNGCAGLFVGTMMAGAGLAVISDGCPTCPNPKVKSYKTKDGSVFYDKEQANWYEQLSQDRKDLYHKNIKICDNYLNSEDYSKEYKQRKQEAQMDGSDIGGIRSSLYSACLKKLNTPDYYGRW